MAPATREAEGRIGRSGQDSKGRGCTDTVQEMVTPNAKVSGGGTPSAALPGYAGDNNNGET